MACGSRRVEVRGNRRGTFPCEGSSRSGTVSWCARGSFTLLHTLSLVLSVLVGGGLHKIGFHRRNFARGVRRGGRCDQLRGQDLLDSYQPQRMVMDERTRTLTHTRVMDFGDFFFWLMRLNIFRHLGLFFRVLKFCFDVGISGKFELHFLSLQKFLE